ncbi:MAG: DUF6282 family protein [Methanobacteriaceae archaeon]|nr:DUF6282 family protein [Methanobacteriaceae archaeon]
MKKLEISPLQGFVDTHIHTAPDTQPRLLNDLEAAVDAKNQKMKAVVIKSHSESTVGRAKQASTISDFTVFGGICLNHNVGGLNPVAVSNAAKMEGKMVWLPTTSYPEINIHDEQLEEIIKIVHANNMVLATGHLNVDDIFKVLDMARSWGVWKILINHPLTGVVDASVDEQIEMGKHAFLEHCFVACMERHDNLNPQKIAHAIREVGSKRCVMATDFGQKHNPKPTTGMKIFINSMLENGISMKEIHTMCSINPGKLLFD